MPKPRVIVAMSGGVDSSVAAALLLEQGYEVIGVTMRLWTVEDASAPRHHRRCCSVEDTDDARAAAGQLGIPHYVLNFERQFAENVIDRFVAEYARGRTPNPCLSCNDHVKFRPLLEHAMALGGDYLATGHYARVRQGDRGFALWRAAGADKDQSYVLYTLGQRELSRTLFPVGELATKDEVRAVARRHRLPNADKPDSADICFIPSGDYRSFVAERATAQPGGIIDGAGNRLGEHAGIVNYTVGQRRGIPATARGEPLFVIGLEAATNEVVVGPAEELLAAGLIAEDLSFVSGQPPSKRFRSQVRIRYRSEPAGATVEIDGDAARVRFDRPLRAVTPGQAAVFYDGECVIGGGTIAGRLDSFEGRESAAQTARPRQ